jgi:hypothetical protein
MEIENGKAKLISNDAITLNNKIVAIFQADDGLLFQTQRNGSTLSTEILRHSF